MSDRTQTLTVELERDEIEALLAPTTSDAVAFETRHARRIAHDKLRNALTQPEHQGEEPCPSCDFGLTAGCTCPKPSAPALSDVDPALARAWQKFMDAPIQQPGKVYVEHDNEDHTGEWMDGEQVNALIRELKSDPSPGEVGRLRERLEAEIEERRSWAAEHRDLATQAGNTGTGEEHLAKAGRIDDDTDRLQALLDPPPPDSQGDQERCKRCAGSGTVSRPHSAYCNCIMTAHCHGKGGKDGKLCRLRRFGSSGEGSPGVAGPPHVTSPCPDCNPAPTQVEQWENDEAEAMVTRLIAGLRQVAGPRTDKAINVSVAAQNVHLAADLLEAQQRERQCQPEPGGEEDWKPVEIARSKNSNGEYFYFVSHRTPCPRRLYIPATSQDSCTGCSECELARELIDARRETERAETALEELASDLEAEAGAHRVDAGRESDPTCTEVYVQDALADAKQSAATRLREKAAELKEGER